ncbi:cob(I)yrinic acid a,c-diamide adenosyltransferase [Lacihabitans sp. CCS-44]|uniref:cob(I)yrinic acid a,c-diamide adenosyltransferase n=1 Tax=Lacihabitans sp. CCS-44 TaxID=2487331 RepID=UPI0020CE36D6|nr:cob(I)yrinic acid a,c-diamide adenosyltransferase [Lacihabitans sp. CCS-44]MCP9757605.1 cob(I)yrinic acid a,c-diamide adenosyltransferase [Lacihabitans sp. CCS-44]
MSKIYTKTGDKGTTSLIGGTRLPKDDIKIEAYGSVDELNAWIGVLADAPENKNRNAFLKEIQDRLFTIGAELASEPEQNKKKLPELFESDIEVLEKEMDLYNEVIPTLRAFVLPGGYPLVSFAHVARTVCRRSERQVIKLSHNEEVNALIIKYLNRLSDYLFVLSRKITQEQNAPEIAWKPR